MGSPLERARKLWKKPSERVTKKDLVPVETYEQDGICAEITAIGWVQLDDDANGDGLGGTPDAIERFCKWYLGIKE